MSPVNVEDMLGIGLILYNAMKLAKVSVLKYAKDLGSWSIEGIRKAFKEGGLEISGSKNIASLGGEVDGFPYYAIAISGENSRPGTVAAPLARKFTTFVVKHERDFDSEVKLLENFAHQFQGTPKVKGNLGLISEIQFCQSCQGVIKQFKEMFPNINLYFINGVK